MKKTYKNQLPKGMEVVETDLRIENGQLVVDVEFKEKFDPKEKFEPKDGDFLVSADTNAVFIYSSKPAIIGDFLCNCYCGINFENKVIIETLNVGWTEKEGCRYATPEEKAAFLERLEKECGKRWNAETKQLEDIRWKPKEGESYYFISSSIQVERIYNMSSIVDKERIEANNCFRTREAAQPYADKMKEMFKNSKAE